MPTINNIIARSNVISGAQDDDFAFGLYRPGVVTNLNVDISRAEMQAINTTPQEVILAPLVGRAIVLVSCQVLKRTGAYTGNHQMRFRLGGTSGDIIATVLASLFTNSASTSGWADISIPDQNFPNTGEALFVTAAGNYSGAGGDVTLRLKTIEILDSP